MFSQSFELENFELFLLIFARVASFMATAPYFSQRGVPNQTKAGIAGILSILLYYTIDSEAVVYGSTIGYALVVLKEVLTGLLIGWAANICYYSVMFAGTLMDMNMGLSMASEYDPSFNTQVTVSGSLYNQFLLLLMIATNTYQFIVRTFIDSFDLIPLGATVFRTDVLITGMVLYATDLFVIGYRIALPIFAAILIMNVVLGIMAKVAPQLNMFTVGIQLKVIAGLIIIFVMVFLFPDVANMIIHQIQVQMANVMEGLHD